jgi:YesN/AraC family two-component response regulator
MIVDDEKDFREGLKTLLEFHGYDVRLAEDEMIGYFSLYSMNFDLIITDILMPEMDGLELILKLKDWKSCCFEKYEYLWSGDN